jgi:hypothetical protein
VKTLAQRLLTGLGILALSSFGFPGIALAGDADSCTAITSVPFTITKAGVYCITVDISTPKTFTSGAAIIVGSDDVTIDLSGHTLSNLAVGIESKAIGISNSGSYINTTVRNGTVRGFSPGISLHGNGVLVENIRADLNTGEAIEVTGTGGVVRNNQILSTGVSAGFPATSGINIAGDGSRVLNNDIVDTRPPAGSNANGILVLSGNGVMVEGNRVNDAIAPSTANPTTGIVFDPSVNSGSAVNNRVMRMTFGIDTPATVAYRDNIVITSPNPYNGALNAGNNQSY